MHTGLGGRHSVSRLLGGVDNVLNKCGNVDGYFWIGRRLLDRPIASNLYGAESMSSANKNGQLDM